MADLRIVRPDAPSNDNDGRAPIAVVIPLAPFDDLVASLPACLRSWVGHVATHPAEDQLRPVTAVLLGLRRRLEDHRPDAVAQVWEALSGTLGALELLSDDDGEAG